MLCLFFFFLEAKWISGVIKKGGSKVPEAELKIDWLFVNKGGRIDQLIGQLNVIKKHFLFYYYFLFFLQFR